MAAFWRERVLEVTSNFVASNCSSLMRARRHSVYRIAAALSPFCEGQDLTSLVRGKKSSDMTTMAFRDTQGRVGILDEYCPHRRASLVYGRNEEGGLRCLYHGWKMDVHGNVTEMVSEPASSGFAQLQDRLRVRRAQQFRLPRRPTLYR